MASSQKEYIVPDLFETVASDPTDLQENNDVPNNDKRTEESSVVSVVDIDTASAKTARVARRVIKQRRGQRYQTKDLIREKSPQPSGQQVMKSVQENVTESQDRESSKDSLKEGSDNNHQQPESTKTVSNSTDSQPLNPSVIVTDGKRLVDCNICHRRMTESRLANHIRLMHIVRMDENSSSLQRPKDYRCEHCGKAYAIKYTYDQHIRTHTEGRPKCPECGSTFASAFSLFRHRAKAHNLEHSYTTHKCNLCDKIFFSLSELNLHIQRHSAQKVHTCPECEKSFSAKGNLRIHMRTHAKEKLYHCDICANTFSHPYSLVSHRRIHTNEFPYTCPECGKNYRSKHQLTSHKNVHSDNRPFVCDQCTKAFKSRTAFKMHQDQHKGIKRFVCKVCDRKFQCQANMVKHERRHSGVKRFKCELCDKAFIEKQELKNHRKVHEKPNPIPKKSQENAKTTENDKMKGRVKGKKTANAKTNSVEVRASTRNTRAKEQKKLQEAEVVADDKTGASKE